jgi:hypothetical protein
MPRTWSVLLIACLASALAPATTLAPLDTGELIDRAARVVCARCESCEARRDPQSGIVFTHVRLAVLEDMKGRSPGAVLELRIVGGKDGNEETVVADMPRFPAGGESVILLGPENRLGYPVVVQASRGVLHLARDERGERYVRTAVTGLADGDDPRRFGLDAFRAAVKRRVREAEERGAAERAAESGR